MLVSRLIKNQTIQALACLINERESYRSTSKRASFPLPFNRLVLCQHLVDGPPLVHDGRHLKLLLRPLGLGLAQFRQLRLGHEFIRGGIDGLAASEALD